MRLLALAPGDPGRTPPAAETAPGRPDLRRAAPWISAAALLAALLLSLRCGKLALPFGTEVRMLAWRLFGIGRPTWPAASAAVLFSIRLPRLTLGALTGGALALAGTGYQGLFRNPLADPYLVGVASGAGLGAVLAFVLPLPAGLYGLGIVQVMAFLGALGAVGLVYAMAWRGRGAPTGTLILSGVAVAALANAGTSYLLYRHGERLQTVYGWLLGGLNSATWSDAALIAPAILASALILILHGRVLNALQLGEEQTASVGVNVERARLLIVCAATLATAAAVSVSGLIGFVGLIVPHAARMLFGADHRRLLPVSALLGAAFLVTADAGARSMPGVSELPVGVVTAACGAPFFLMLLHLRRRETD
jgi:iron complex transport system permease protein